MKLVVPVSMSLLATAIAIVASRMVERLSVRVRVPVGGPVA